MVDPNRTVYNGPDIYQHQYAQFLSILTLDYNLYGNKKLIASLSSQTLSKMIIICCATKHIILLHSNSVKAERGQVKVRQISLYLVNTNVQYGFVHIIMPFGPEHLPGLNL